MTEESVTVQGFTFDQADSRHSDLDDAHEYLCKAIQSLDDASFPTVELTDIQSNVWDERFRMKCIKYQIARLEENPGRLGGQDD